MSKEKDAEMKAEKEKGNAMRGSVMGHFHAINTCPRPSYYQGEVSDFMVKFGEDLKLSTIKNTASEKEPSVVIFKPAQHSVNTTVPVILQAHMDLVFDIKPKDAKYDSTKNPVIPKICENNVNLMRGYGTKLENGKYVIDENMETSLGADDGIGVAIVMAILQDESISHPPIIAIFTTNEEVGMFGALKLDADFIHSAVDIDTKMKWEEASFINVDEEQHGRFCYGCAGGVDTRLTLEYKENTSFVADEYKIYTISVSGLRGGHSGVEIHERRANAHRLMGRVLSYIQADYEIDFELFSILGGKKTNAIPHFSDAVVGIPVAKVECFEKAIQNIEECLKQEYKDIENMEKIEKTASTEGKDAMKIACEPCTDAPNFPMSKNDRDNIVSMLYLIPNDVLGFYDYKDYSVVETSSNLGIIEKKGNCIILKCAVRSFFDWRRDFVCSQIATLGKLLNFTSERDNEYPGWTQNANSKLNDIFEKSFKVLFPTEKPPLGRIIHAGLENGVFAKILGNIDMIACGPTIHDVHTINERLELDTVGKTIELLQDVLLTLSEKPRAE